MANYEKAVGASYGELKKLLTNPKSHNTLIQLGLYDRKQRDLTETGKALRDSQADKAKFAATLFDTLREATPEIIALVCDGVSGYKYEIVDEIHRRVGKYSKLTVETILSYLEQSGGVRLVKAYKVNPVIQSDYVFLLVRNLVSSAEQLRTQLAIDKVAAALSIGGPEAADIIRALVAAGKLKYMGTNNVYLALRSE